MPLVAEVLDVAVGVVMLLLVEGIDLAKVITNGSDVIGDHINHHIDVSLVALGDECLEIVLRAEVGVQLLPVSSPIAVVAFVEVIHHGRNPDGVEAHTLNVVQVVHDTLVGASTVVGQVATGPS